MYCSRKGDPMEDEEIVELLLNEKEQNSVGQNADRSLEWSKDVR